MKNIKIFFLNLVSQFRQKLLIRLDKYSYKSYNLKDVYLLAEKFYQLIPFMSGVVKYLFLAAVIFSYATLYCIAVEQHSLVLFFRCITRGLFCLGVLLQYQVEYRIFQQNLSSFTSEEQIVLIHLIKIKGLYRAIFLLFSFFFVVCFIEYFIKLSELKILGIQNNHNIAMAELDEAIAISNKQTAELGEKYGVYLSPEQLENIEREVRKKFTK